MEEKPQPVNTGLWLFYGLNGISERLRAKKNRPLAVLKINQGMFLIIYYGKCASTSEWPFL